MPERSVVAAGDAIDHLKSNAKPQELMFRTDSLEESRVLLFRLRGAGGALFLLLCSVRFSLFLRGALMRRFWRFVTHGLEGKVRDNWRQHLGHFLAVPSALPHMQKAFLGLRFASDQLLSARTSGAQEAVQRVGFVALL